MLSQPMVGLKILNPEFLTFIGQNGKKHLKLLSFEKTTYQIRRMLREFLDFAVIDDFISDCLIYSTVASRELICLVKIEDVSYWPDEN
jgi:hypothetical protein